jgi:hypothetical protein
VFKAVLIIFVMQIGYDGGSQTDVGDVDVILMESMAQCEFVRTTMSEELPFGWGHGKGEKRRYVEVGMSSKCFNLPKDAQVSLQMGGSIDADGIARQVLENLHSEEPDEFVDPNHTRWDHKRWNEQ